MGRIAGIDFGQKRIGVALSDLGKSLASPLTRVDSDGRTETSIEGVLKALEKHPVEAIVVGHPLNMNGKKGPMADQAAHFAAQLQTKVSCPVHLWDERLTSLQADRALKEVGLSRKRRTEALDTAAAVIMLQSYLDAHRQDLS